MLKDYTSRYLPRYPESLVYMLQATEYDIPDFLHWYKRTQDFSYVEKRKQLKKTPKALLLLVFARLITVLIYCAALSAFFIRPIYIGCLLFLLGLFLAPYLVTCGILLLLLAGRYVAQRPIEFLITLRARQHLARHPGFRIAIAGSFGKTSMREIVKTVLAESKKVVAPPFNYNTPLGISKFILGLSGNEEVLIFELGEYYPGDVRRLCKLVQPELGIITGINEAHLQKFKTLDKTISTIFELADWLGDKPLYINGESELAAQAAHEGHILYTRKGAGRWHVRTPHTDLSGTSFSLIAKGVEISAKTQLLGLHQIGPLAAAADIASRLGLSDAQIISGIAKTKPFEHRLEPKPGPDGIITLDDSYNGNPDGVKAVIGFLALLKGHRRFYVTPGLVEMGSRAKSVHEEIGKELADADIEKVILLRNSVTPFIEVGLKKNNFRGEIIWFDDALTAFSTLSHMTVKGDVVLLQNDWPDQYI